MREARLQGAPVDMDEVHQQYKNTKLLYLAACEEAEAMDPANALRLGLFCNYTVFLYEVTGAIEDARVLSLKSFDLALYELQHMSQDEIREAIPIMQCLHDNYRLWETEELSPKQKAEIMEANERERLAAITLKAERMNKDDYATTSEEEESDEEKEGKK